MDTGVIAAAFLYLIKRSIMYKPDRIIERHHQGADRAEVEAFLARFEAAPLAEKEQMIQALKQHKTTFELTKAERRTMKRSYRHELVKRSALLKIAAAWIITVPVSGLLAGLLYFTIRGMML